MSATNPKTVLCTCNKTFGTSDAMLQHVQSSLRHKTTPQQSELMPWVENLVQRLSLQDDEPGHFLVPFKGGEPSKLSTTNSGNNVSRSLVADAGMQIFAESVKPKKSNHLKISKNSNKSKTIKTVGTGLGPPNSSTPTMEIFENTDYTMDMYGGYDWGLCDKDCGWCGHCADGVDY
ncbi:uncharacterized protein RSE6_04112 [Rhynchosporium secalis]|uniref:Uncharacterized protein n=1 Tax=Rhynchosporium secalis TaxID=38038 RepID=A0A1E1M4G7_RHYSE|nr:uncharacterized protein RSE6_04112 [Rhynchosporium secalis]